MNRILRVKNQQAEEVAILIVGNKKDLEEKRQVKSREGEEFAKKYGADFIEVSSKTGENIEEAFKRICYLIWARKDGHTYLLVKDWTEEEHSKLPETFKKRVKTFLLILKRNELNEKKLKVPKPLVTNIIKQFFKQDSFN